MKVFSGSEIYGDGFKEKIEAIGVDTVMKIIFNQLDWRVLEAQVSAVEVFIQETDFSKANPVIEEVKYLIKLENYKIKLWLLLYSGVSFFTSIYKLKKNR
jgi:hypothetical protein